MGELQRLDRIVDKSGDEDDEPRGQPSVESLCGRAADGLTSAEHGYNHNVRLSILGECHAVLWACHAVASAESARPES